MPAALRAEGQIAGNAQIDWWRSGGEGTPGEADAVRESLARPTAGPTAEPQPVLSTQSTEITLRARSLMNR